MFLNLYICDIKLTSMCESVQCKPLYILMRYKIQLSDLEVSINYYHN